MFTKMSYDSTSLSLTDSCCYASTGRHERWRGALLAEGLEVGRERGSRAAWICAPQEAPLW
jgi:hypothetical protein